MRSDGVSEGYLMASDKAAFWFSKFTIVSKKVTSDSSVEYTVNYKMTHPGDGRSMELGRISNNGTVWEFVNVAVADFSENAYPKRIDPSHSSYHRYKLLAKQ
jgi:hypothetical protein